MIVHIYILVLTITLPKYAHEKDVFGNRWCAGVLGTVHIHSRAMTSKDDTYLDGQGGEPRMNHG